MILKLIEGWKGVDCIRLARDREKWRAAVDTVMNLRYTVNTSTRITKTPTQL
jgi:hypothetical protein